LHIYYIGIEGYHSRDENFKRGNNFLKKKSDFRFGPLKALGLKALPFAPVSPTYVSSAFHKIGLNSQPLWGEEEEANYQHTFVSGPSIELALLSFNGTGTLHDPMAMSCFMFLCCLEQIGYFARYTWNLSIQL
jgi:hypothetical protein